MLERLLHFFLSEPRRLTSLGEALIRTGGFLLIAGLIGRVATTATSAVHSLSGIQRTGASLGDLLPEYLSFWIPEGTLGFSLAAFVIAFGLWTVRFGRVCERHLGA